MYWILYFFRLSPIIYIFGFIKPRRSKLWWAYLDWESYTVWRNLGGFFYDLGLSNPLASFNHTAHYSLSARNPSGPWKGKSILRPRMAKNCWPCSLDWKLFQNDIRFGLATSRGLDPFRTQRPTAGVYYRRRFLWSRTYARGYSQYIPKTFASARWGRADE